MGGTPSFVDFFKTNEIEIFFFFWGGVFFDGVGDCGNGVSGSGYVSSTKLSGSVKIRYSPNHNNC